MKYLNGTYKNLEELKKAYRNLCKTYHPDLNPNGLEIMKVINNEYEDLFNILKNQSTTKTEEKATDFIDLLKNIINLDITIEIVGSWIWVSGNTYDHKETLKANGFKWASKKKMWYLNPTGTQKKTKKQYSMDTIKSMYGAQTIKTQSTPNKTKQLI